MKPTAAPMAATTRPASTPTTAASTMMLDSRARTMARRRCGTSNDKRGLMADFGLNQSMETIRNKAGRWRCL